MTECLANKKIDDFCKQVCNCLYDCQDLNLLVKNFTDILKLYDSESFQDRKNDEHDSVDFLIAVNLKILLIVRLLALVDGCKSNKTYSLSFLVNSLLNKNTSLKQTYDDMLRKYEKLLSNMSVLRDKVFAHNESISEQSNLIDKISAARSDISNEELNSLIDDIVFILKLIKEEYSLSAGIFQNSAYEVPVKNWVNFHYSKITNLES